MSGNIDNTHYPNDPTLKNNNNTSITLTDLSFPVDDPDKLDPLPPAYSDEPNQSPPNYQDQYQQYQQQSGQQQPQQPAHQSTHQQQYFQSQPQQQPQPYQEPVPQPPQPRPHGNSTPVPYPKACTTAALEFRTTTRIPDPNTKAGKLYSKMAAVVGQQNICPIPIGLVDEEDQKLWLKSDSNSLLYFFYKSPKARIAIQKQIDKGCCYHGCYNSEENCSCDRCCECCCPYAMLFFPTLCCIPCLCDTSSQALARDHTYEVQDKFMFGSRMYYRDQREYVQNITLNDASCCGQAGLPMSEFDRVYQRWFYQPIVNAGFKFSKPTWTTCCHCCFYLRDYPESNRHQHIHTTWAKFRYGNKGKKENFNVLTGTNLLIKYRKDCLNDMAHPHYNFNLKPREWRDREPDGWIGQREVAPDEWETQIPLADLNLKELNYVVETHNKKWGGIKSLDPSTLDLQYIFPGQSQ